MSQIAVKSGRRRLGRVIVVLPLMLAMAGCAGMSWKHPSTWNPFKKHAEAPPTLVEVLNIESTSAGGGDRFTQAWEGVRLVVDIYSASGTGRATLRPRDQGWPLRLAFRLHLQALEGFEVRGAQNLRFSLGSQTLPEAAWIDLPYGVYTKDSLQLDIEWADHYR